MFYHIIFHQIYPIFAILNHLWIIYLINIGRDIKDQIQDTIAMSTYDFIFKLIINNILKTQPCLTKFQYEYKLHFIPNQNILGCVIQTSVQ